MTDFNTALRRIILPLFLLCSVNVCALNICGFAKQKDGDATVTFCKAFAVKYVSLEDKGLGPVLVMPKDLGGYKNLIVTSKILDGQIKKCFSAPCLADGAEKSAKEKLSTVFKIKSTKLFKSKQGIIATVSFDDSFDAVFLVSKYKRLGKDVFRIKNPQDLTFVNDKLKQNVRAALKAQAKKLL